MLPTSIFLNKKLALNNALKFEEIYIIQKKELNDMMHEIYRSQKHPMLPTKLNGKLEKQGYKNIKTLEIPFFFTNKETKWLLPVI